PAGAGRGVDVRAVDPHAVARGLHDGVRLGVHRADAVAVLHEVAVLVAVRQAPDAAVVAGGEDALVAHDDRADELAVAGRARGDLARDVHEVVVPGDAGAGHVGRAL